MPRLLEDPLACEFGDAFPDDGRVVLWGWDVDDALWASTLYNPDSESIDPALQDRYFIQLTAEIDNEAVDLAVRVDPDNWIVQYPYGWNVIAVLTEGQ